MVAVEEEATDKSAAEDIKEESPFIQGEQPLAAKELVFGIEDPPLVIEALL